MRMNFTVSLDRSRDIEQVVKELRSVGLVVQRELPRIGVVSGSADECAVSAIRHVGGVISVEPEGFVQIAPPSSSVQ
jgi:hypothetical protein